jgi:hypothetical protein
MTLAKPEGAAEVLPYQWQAHLCSRTTKLRWRMTEG